MLTDVKVPSTCTLCHSVMQKRIETPAQAHAFYPPERSKTCAQSDPKFTPEATPPPPLNKPHTLSLNLLGKHEHRPSLHCPSFVSTPNPKDLVLQLLLGIQQDQQFAVVLKGCNFESAMCPLHMQSPCFQDLSLFSEISASKLFHCKNLRPLYIAEENEKL